MNCPKCNSSNVELVKMVYITNYIHLAVKCQDSLCRKICHVRHTPLSEKEFANAPYVDSKLRARQKAGVLSEKSGHVSPPQLF